jgi:hypothetical protein
MIGNGEAKKESIRLLRSRTPTFFVKAIGLTVSSGYEGMRCR